MTSPKAGHIKLTGREIQSGWSRVRIAESLIEQLPKTHDGRNSWLMNYGVRQEANEIRIINKIEWDEECEAAKLSPDADLDDRHRLIRAIPGETIQAFAERLSRKARESRKLFVGVHNDIAISADGRLNDSGPEDVVSQWNLICSYRALYAQRRD